MKNKRDSRIRQLFHTCWYKFRCWNVYLYSSKQFFSSPLKFAKHEIQL